MIRSSTVVQPKLELLPFDYRQGLFLIGSCFTEYIGERLSNAGLSVHMNPMGITYNPLSIKKSFEYLAGEHSLQDADFQQRDDVHFHWDFHSRFSKLDREPLKKECQESIVQAKRSIENSSLVIVSLGTAWIYELEADAQVVNNCHKMPNDLFNKRLLSYNELVSALSDILDLLKLLSPEVRVLFTLSPVRHWKDGAEQNSLSKALLRSSIGAVTRKEQALYFPSYEIMMDELRDYRYYASDLIHPSEIAQEIIWERFKESIFTNKSLDYIQAVEAYQKMKSHRPILPDSQGARAFAEKLKETKRSILHTYPDSPFQG
ncbi:MAG: GSCFA domain-containing protein [Flavobacteriales bacterium]|nr:GSCFA domain-containing protein [Flavobacteriales bacterium]